MSLSVIHSILSKPVTQPRATVACCSICTRSCRTGTEMNVAVVTGDGPVETEGLSLENDPHRELKEIAILSLCEVETHSENE